MLVEAFEMERSGKESAHQSRNRDQRRRSEISEEILWKGRCTERRRQRLPPRNHNLAAEGTKEQCVRHFRDLFVMRLSRARKTRKDDKKRAVMSAYTAITPSKLKSGWKFAAQGWS